MVNDLPGLNIYLIKRDTDGTAMKTDMTGLIVGAVALSMQAYEVMKWPRAGQESS